MKKYQLMIGLFMLLWLSGCVEVKEDIWVNTDGSGRMKIDIGIASEEVPTFGSESVDQAIKSYRENMAKDMEVKKGKIAGIKHVKNVQIAQSYAAKKGELDHCVYDIRTGDIDSFNDIYKEIQREQIDEDVNWNISVEKLKGRRILFTQVFENVEGKKDVPEEEKEAPEASEKRFYTVKLHAPKIVSTNGELDKRSRTAEWIIPFADLSSDYYYKKELKAEIQLPLIRYPLIFIILVMIIIFLSASGIYAVSRKRNK